MEPRLLQEVYEVTDEEKTKEQLMQELVGLRRRTAELEILESERKRAQEEKAQLEAKLVHGQRLLVEMVRR